MMRTALNIDDTLLEQARQLNGIQEKTKLVREGLKALIEKQAAPEAGRLGRHGARPQARYPPPF